MSRPTTSSDRDMARRADAYVRVMQRLRQADGGELHDDERALIREACDALLFGEDDAPRAGADARDAIYGLVEAGRWSSARAGRLLSDVEACGEARALARL